MSKIKEEAYHAGQDAGLNGGNEENSHMKFFTSPELSAAWQEGYEQGKKIREENKIKVKRPNIEKCSPLPWSLAKRRLIDRARREGGTVEIVDAKGRSVIHCRNEEDATLILFLANRELIFSPKEEKA